MCLAVPGKIIEIKKDKATVDYGVEKRTAQLIEKNYSLGDFVIIQGGVVIQKVDKTEAEEALQHYMKSVS